MTIADDKVPEPIEIDDGLYVVGTEIAEAAVREYLERRGWTVERVTLAYFDGATIYGQPPALGGTEPRAEPMSEVERKTECLK